MIRIVYLFFIVAFLSSCTSSLTFKQEIYTTDIDNYWMAYDKIVATNDSTLQYQYINDYYISKGSTGLKNIMLAKNYTASDYVQSINNYPKFWASIRPNTYLSKTYDKRIMNSIGKLQKLYPGLKPVPIYFTIGAFRTGGTIFDNTVLIGTELSLADKSTHIEELPEWRKPFFIDYNPIDGIELLCTHEYVHTQQSALIDNLLIYCLYEGVAEFVSTKALGVPSNTPAIQFGKENERVVKHKFEQDLFIPRNTYNWIWGENQNELKVRDLGYYIGFSIAEGYFNKAIDKSKAIKEMIELDFTNDDQIESFVDAATFFSDSLSILYNRFEESIPTVLFVEPAINGSLNVSTTISTITIHFSEPMDKESRGFDYGPLGEDNVLRIEKVIGFSADGLAFTFQVKMDSNRHYQSMVTNRFVSEKGIPLKPFLFDFETRE